MDYQMDYPEKRKEKKKEYLLFSKVCWCRLKNPYPSNYSQTFIKWSPPIKRTLFKFPKIGPSIYCKFNFF